jgi:hypothetical protein
MVWQAGKSGNPSGRAKHSPAMREAIRIAKDLSPKSIMKLADLMEHSADENVQMSAAKALLDRAFGKPHQSVAIEGNEHSFADQPAEERLRMLLAAVDAVTAELKGGVVLQLADAKSKETG